MGDPIHGCGNRGIPSMSWQKLPNPTPTEITQRRLLKRSKFLIDESLGPGTKQFFQLYRMNAVTVWDIGINGQDDEVVFAQAWRHRRILLTHDGDFWDDRRFPEHRNPGIVILPGAEGDQTDMISGLAWMTGIMDRDPEMWLKRKVRITRDGNVYIKSRRRRTRVMEIAHYQFTNGTHALLWV
jgi:predicted nuclease of predicted toxin-antitoxin system